MVDIPDPTDFHERLPEEFLTCPCGSQNLEGCDGGWFCHDCGCIYDYEELKP